jgi:predicted ATPase
MAAVSTLERGTRNAPQRHTLTLLIEALALAPEQRAELESAAARRRTRNRAPIEPPAAFAGAKLPVYLSSFVGREAELADVVTLVRDQRLVTIVGAGGMGKTRLACVVATTLVHAFERIAFLDLARIVNPELLALQVASALGIEAKPSGSAARIAGVLTRERTLLLLDNSEHIVEPVAHLTAELLQLSPTLHVLSTSRERLAINGEHVYRLSSLALEPSIELFVQRAQESDPYFDLSDALRPAAIDVVRRLDGMPLAIELTVARLPALGLPELRRRLDRLLALPGANRDAPARQHTMRATIAWSYDLLEEPAQTILARLAIFVGGFTLDAAEIVCSCEIVAAEDVSTIIPQLVERSLVQAIPGESRRYRLLETVRVFGLELLDEHKAFAAVMHRHAAWLADIGDASNAEMAGGASRTVVREILADLANVRAALDRLLNGGNVSNFLLAARVAGGLRPLWISLGAGHTEGHRWATLILAGLDDEQQPELFGRVLRLQFQTARWEYEELAGVQRALRLFARTGDRIGLVSTYAHSIELFIRNGDRDEAGRFVEESRSLLEGDLPVERVPYAFLAAAHCLYYASRGDFQRAHAEIALAAQILGKPAELDWTLSTIKADTEALQGHFQRAIAITESGIAHWPVGYRWSRLAAENRVASYRFLDGDIVGATRTAREILLGDPGVSEEDFVLDQVVALSAAIAAAGGRVELAARLAGFAEAADVWGHVTFGGRLVRTRLEDILNSSLGHDERAALTLEGRRVTLPDAVRIALEGLP